jgi:hypothetical protein
VGVPLSIINQSIEKFIRNIQEITDEDYGDFMRNANGYLLDLKNEIRVYLNLSVDETIASMQNYIQFNPNWDILTTRQRLIIDAKYIDELLAAEQQDWESWAP